MPSGLLSRRRGPAALTMHIAHVDKKANTLSLLSNKYKISEKMGSGCATIVRRAIHLESGNEVALKMPRSDDEGAADAARKEYELLRHLEPHPNIIKALDFHNLHGEATLVLELFTSSTLHAMMKKVNALPESTVKCLSTSLCNAVAHLHGKNILHRDIKPQNVLISPCLCNLRLIDFNAAACLDDALPLTPTGTELYKAPELLLGESACPLSDVWASGLCIFFMLSGRLPQSRDMLDPLSRVKEEVAMTPPSFEGHRWQQVSAECTALLQRCLDVQREERPAMTQVLDDVWFTDSIMNRLSLLGRMVPGSEAYLSVLSSVSQYAIKAQAT